MSRWTLRPRNSKSPPWGIKSGSRRELSVLWAAKHDEGVYRLHSLT
jgi:hypothetical protein